MMMKLVVVVFMAVVISSYANPMPQNGKWGIDLNKNHGTPLTGNIYGEHKWDFDRGNVGVSGNHQREFGGMKQHQTNVGVSGQYDVFRSDDGKTTGTVFGGANQQWNSHGPNSRGYEYGGRLEHTWG